MHKISINGLGRIGRNFLAVFLNDKNANFKISSVNDVADINTLTHLYNCGMPKHNGKISTKNGRIYTNKGEITFTSKKLDTLDWSGSKIVIEATGKFFSYKQAGTHLKNGVKTVIISSPSHEADITLVPGINHEKYSPEKHKIISASSCTAQAVLPIIQALRPLGIEKTSFTTTHPYTVNNALLDNSGRNLRESRSATLSIVPAQTRADTGFTEVFSDTNCMAYSFKIPTSRVACLDTVIKTKNKTSVYEINSLLENYSRSLPYLLATTNLELVSTDLINHASSSVVDLSLTQVIDDLVRVFSWYDNEYAYSMRLYELTKFIASKL